MKYLHLNLKFLTLVVVLLTVVGCVSSDDNGPTLPIGRTLADVREDFSNINFEAGINDITLESLDNVFWNFRIIVPENATSANIRPLIFVLHDDSETAPSNAHQQTACLYAAAFEDLDAYIISPNSNQELWFSEDNQWQIVILFDLIRDYLFIDDTNTAIAGFGDGGNGSWFYADFYSNLFVGAIPIASSHNTADENGNGVKTPLPLYVIHGSDDQVAPVEDTTGYVDLAIDAGTDIVFVVADGLGHDDQCDYESYLEVAGTWLVDFVWD